MKEIEDTALPDAATKMAYPVQLAQLKAANMEPTSLDHSEGRVEASEFAQAIVDILRERGASEHPMLLSSLGQRIAAKFGRPIRTIIGERKLSDVITDSLGDLVALEGEGSRKAVRLDNEAGAASKPIRYDPAFWAAFSKPISPEKHRWLRPTRPFSFDDTEDSQQQNNDFLYVDRSLIPDVHLIKPERDAHVRESITEWCRSNNLEPSYFFVKVPKFRSQFTAGDQNSEKLDSRRSGVTALRKMIESIPVDERGKYTMSLDLIYTLIVE